MPPSAVVGAIPPPPGVTPNLQHPEDVIATVNMATQISSICLMTPFIALRMYAKGWVAPPFLLDDWACLVAWKQVGYFGGGHHVWDLSPETYEGFLKALYADSLVYGFSAWFTKFALLLVIGRVFETFKVTRIISWVLIVLLGLFYIAGFIVKAQVRHPVDSYWNLKKPGTNSVSQRAVFVADTVMSTISDLAVLILPIPAVISLKLSLWKKLKIWSMLGLGGVATMAGIVRLIFVVQFQKSADQSVSFIRFNMFATAELTVGVICACLPACGILIARSRNAAAASTGETTLFSSNSRFMSAMKSIKFSLRTKSETTARRTATAATVTMPVTFTNATAATTVVNTRRGGGGTTVLGGANEEEPHPGVNVADMYLGSWRTPPSTSDDNGSSRTMTNNYMTYTNNDNTPVRTTNMDASTEMDTDVERGGS
ncbi:hypothetical protein PG991_008262 [Apiospora marii]|uniref:Rhodopsin domain-containing protein n=1 Tax=Apiospora marii TaxID=335849 RepID=A0ABR1RQD9_9PEZI